MAETAVADDVAPFLIKDEVDNLGKDAEAEMQSVTAGVNSKRSGWNIFAFLYRRSTYYWIALIAQFSQITLQIIGFAVSVAYKELNKKGDNNSYTAALSLTVAIFALFPLFLIMCLIVVHYNKSSDAPGPKRITAGKHYNVTKFCALLNFVILEAVMRPVWHHSEQNYVDDIRPVIIPLIFGFSVVAFSANVAAAYVTYAAAKQARGTAKVPDPEYRVSAWKLATTEESQSLWRQNAIQLPL